MDDNLIVFLGRFHPLVVHLPIGIILLAGLMQIISFMSSSYSRALNPAISFTLFWGGISSIGAIAIGWLLSLQGGYDDDTLFWHKWLGILLCILCFFAWVLKTNKIRFHKSFFYIVFGTVIALVAVTGHLGGNLTHGKTYLMHYAPNFLKKLTGFDTDTKNSLLTNMDPDSIQVYPYIIQPILDKKCISCHNSEKQAGGLLLTNYKGIIKGGDNGTIINSKNPYKSELLNRVTLPKDHKKFMPPKGAVITYSEIQIIDWWMRNGADSISRFANSIVLDEKLAHTLLRDYQLDYFPKAYYEKVKVDSISSKSLQELVRNEFDFISMGEENNMISVTFKGDSITKNHMKKLVLAKGQVTWLDLSNCNLTDDLLVFIKDFEHLTRLNLHSNPITDDSNTSLKNFEHLKSLNIYNTKISDKSFEKLLQLPALSKIYIWKTNITMDKIDELANKYSKIDIIGNLH